MECPHCGAEALMGAATCVSCGGSMFAQPGEAASLRRPETTPAPWRESAGGTSGPIEHRSISVDPERASPTASPFGVPDESDDRPAFLADEKPGSGVYQDDRQRETVSGFPYGTPGEPALPADDTAAAAPESGDLPPDMPAPVAIPQRARRSLCTICFGPTHNAFAEICEECDERASGTYDAETGRANIRVRRPRKRKTGAAKRVFVLVLLGAGMVVGGMAVVDYVNRPKPGMALIKDARSEPTEVGFAIPDMGATDFRTEFDVRLVRERRRSALAAGLSTVFDIQQRAAHLTRVTLLESRADTAVLNVRTETKLERQDGDYETQDQGRVEVYPWDGHLQVSRVHAPLRGQVAFVGGKLPVPARDVPPFVTFGTTDAPEGPLAPGRTWEGSADLPCVVGLGGELTPYPFDCEFEFVGRRVFDGRPCAVVQLTARPKAKASVRLRDVDSAGGTVAGALAFDIDTGLLVRALLEIDTVVRQGSAGDPDESVTLKGKLTISRTTL